MYLIIIKLYKKNKTRNIFCKQPTRFFAFSTRETYVSYMIVILYCGVGFKWLSVCPDFFESAVIAVCQGFRFGILLFRMEFGINVSMSSWMTSITPWQIIHEFVEEKHTFTSRGPNIEIVHLQIYAVLPCGSIFEDLSQFIVNCQLCPSFERDNRKDWKGIIMGRTIDSADESVRRMPLECPKGELGLILTIQGKEV